MKFRLIFDLVASTADLPCMYLAHQERCTTCSSVEVMRYHVVLPCDPCVLFSTQINCSVVISLIKCKIGCGISQERKGKEKGKKNCLPTSAALTGSGGAEQ